MSKRSSQISAGPQRLNWKHSELWHDGSENYTSTLWSIQGSIKYRQLSAGRYLEDWKALKTWTTQYPSIGTYLTSLWCFFFSLRSIRIFWFCVFRSVGARVYQRHITSLIILKYKFYNIQNIHYVYLILLTYNNYYDRCVKLVWTL